MWNRSPLYRSLWIVCFVFLFAMPIFAATDFTVPPGRSANPYNVIVGPDKNLWFSEVGGEKIGRLTASGAVTEFPIPGAQQLVGIASGPDGNIWFTDQLSGKIGRISTSGTNIAQISLPKGSFPQAITAGPDGNLWFVDQKQSGVYAIGKITTKGAITEYSTKINVGTFNAYGEYSSITAGHDGNLWFVNPQNGSKQVGGITTTGTLLTPIPTADLPIAITLGPDDNLWVIENTHVAKIASGAETEYALTKAGGTTGIASGPDGNVWFTESDYSYGYVVPSTGAVTEFPNQYPALLFADGITAGPDGALWVTGWGSDTIARVNTSGTVTNSYSVGLGSGIGFDAPGPDGNVWFTEFGIANMVGNINPITHVIHTYSIPSPNSDAGYIAPGGDGNMWFIEQIYGQIAKVTPEGAITEYPDADAFVEIGLTAAKDGNVWYTAPFTTVGPSIARITPTGTITLFPISYANALPVFITSGPDGNLWFTDIATSSIGVMDLNGNTLHQYPVTTNPANLSAITTGSDGNLWFLENTSYGAVGKMTLSGVVTEYPAQIQNYQDGIAAGSDGAIWFAQAYPNGIARVTTNGIVSTVALTTSNAGGNAVTAGPDKKIWVAEGTAGAMGRLSPIGGTGKAIKATHGILFKGAVATFVDGYPSSMKTDFTTKVNWGDGSSSAGEVLGNTGGPFTVGDEHTYSAVGTYTVQVSLHDTVDNSTYLATPSKATVK